MFYCFLNYQIKIIQFFTFLLFKFYISLVFFFIKKRIVIQINQPLYTKQKKLTNIYNYQQFQYPMNEQEFLEDLNSEEFEEIHQSCVIQNALIDNTISLDLTDPTKQKKTKTNKLNTQIIIQTHPIFQIKQTNSNKTKQKYHKKPSKKSTRNTIKYFRINILNQYIKKEQYLQIYNGLIKQQKKMIKYLQYTYKMNKR
ncbi:hypothetical protein IMG5_046000 [Ichthyophthirius multifiliis]|uniref:Transmembrane protein n=1 Tax=Ichthyophthirius multifiliis TaxID=5932 RepID=G0QM82_ICHMU|nr:hypothetical protein IMG5_046000 [Ichthyophthirius multifiliis]EGR33685.1 hypothetical protein IMG5_046000 [Ichthyophthirius multifiliis]|eukprot:XP_004037671.1 hypothetical protein IMG5_046000 [Ichthyophthirius multifiliis]